MSVGLSAGGEEHLLQEYLDALLPIAAAGPSTAPAGPTTAPAGSQHYWLVSAGGLQLALPASQVRIVPGGEAPQVTVSGPVAVIDLASVVAGRPPAAESCAGAYLAVPAFPGRLLRVEKVQRLIEVEDEAVRWREVLQPRPWLTGMVQSPAAAVLSVHELVRENQGGD